VRGFEGSEQGAVPEVLAWCLLHLGEDLLKQGTDILQHTFPGGQTGTVRVGLHQEISGRCVLIVWRNAPGFPVGVDFQTAESPGLQPVCLLSAQWGGTVALQPDARTVCAVTSPR